MDEPYIYLTLYILKQVNYLVDIFDLEHSHQFWTAEHYIHEHLCFQSFSIVINVTLMNIKQMLCCIKYL